MKKELTTLYLQSNNIYIELFSKTAKDIANMSDKDKARLIKNLEDIKEAASSLITIFGDDDVDN